MGGCRLSTFSLSCCLPPGDSWRRLWFSPWSFKALRPSGPQPKHEDNPLPTPLETTAFLTFLSLVLVLDSSQL